jgi:hypothetical protein
MMPAVAAVLAAAALVLALHVPPWSPLAAYVAEQAASKKATAKLTKLTRQATPRVMS